MGRQAQEEGSQHGTAHAEGSGQESPRRVCSWRRPLGLEHRVYRGAREVGGAQLPPRGLGFSFECLTDPSGFHKTLRAAGMRVG